MLRTHKLCKSDSSLASSLFAQGFFRRALQDIGDPAQRRCYYDQNCDINIITRNRCQYCRLKKCLVLGMSREGMQLCLAVCFTVH